MTNAFRSVRAMMGVGLAAIAILSTAGLAQDGSNPGAASKSFFGLLNGHKYGSVVYSRGNDYELKCDVYVPNGVGPFPAVLAVHGGAWRCGSKVNLTGHALEFCNRGFVVVSINYRHAPRYRFPAQIEDCRAALRFMRDQSATYQIDTEQVFGFGYSAGGHLISLLATTSGNNLPDGESADERGAAVELKGIAAGGVPCDFDWLPGNSTFLNYWLGATKSQDPRLFQEISPARHLSPAAPPFLLYHGVDDRIVPIACVERMEQSCARLGIRCEVVRLPGAGHFEAFAHLDMAVRAAEFFRQIIAECNFELERENHSQGR